MNPIDKQLMMGMIDILNNYSDILTEDQISLRLEDLKQFEKETNFVFTNSPTCKDKISSIVGFNSNIYKNKFDKCHDVRDIIKFANQKEILIYPNIVGNNITITYCNGIIDNLIIDNALVNLEKVINIPYKIDRSDVYIVNGIVHNLNFYVTNIVDGGCNETIFDNFKEAEEFGFDIVPYWTMSVINPKKFDDNINYVYEYVGEEGLVCNGIVFRFNDISYSQDGIVYEMLK